MLSMHDNEQYLYEALLWCRPYHLTPAEAERWASAQVKVLVNEDGVRGAVLTRLGDASARHRCDWDWLLELEVALPAGEWLDEWLGDLRLLGSRPAVVLAADSIPLEDA